MDKLNMMVIEDKVFKLLNLQYSREDKSLSVEVSGDEYISFIQGETVKILFFLGIGTLLVTKFDIAVDYEDVYYITLEGNLL